MTAIVDIVGREILDSRGNPTVRWTCCWWTARFGRAARALRRSTGAHEAVELRDGDKGRYISARGVEKGRRCRERARSSMPSAVSTPRTGEDRPDPHRAWTGTPNKARIGANAILGVSLAVAKAAAQAAAFRFYRYVAA